MRYYESLDLLYLLVEDNISTFWLCVTDYIEPLKRRASPAAFSRLSSADAGSAQAHKYSPYCQADAT